MNTPIADFVKAYEKQNTVRLHMPGHKGKSFLGCEAVDITEIKGADALYEADGIIAESEANAAKLFGAGKTLYSTEGASQCIRAMLYLAMTHEPRCEEAHISKTDTEKPIVVATRNVHKSFVQAAALLDIDVEWLYPEENLNSICCCNISTKQLTEKLQSLSKTPIAVYVTSPDYLGGQLDIKGLAETCHQNGTILAVDNAHGAYLRFLNPSQHPMDLGADICCDSAHKTLPVLTGGAYLHISKNAPQGLSKNARQAMALFGSTSPSYLTLTSLDLCNRYLSEGYQDKLLKTIEGIQKLREDLQNKGWEVEETDPLKLTICAPCDLSGIQLAEHLRESGVECEYADPEYVVCMFTPENDDADYTCIQKDLCAQKAGNEKDVLRANQSVCFEKQDIKIAPCKRSMSIREAVFARHEEIPVTKALGRICAIPTVSCPPAIPIVVSGEMIDENAVKLFQYYGIATVEVVVTEF